MNVALLVPRGTPLVTERHGLVRTQVRAALWRVTQPAGAVVGYIERVDEGAVERFRVKRLGRDFRTFVALGDYDSFEDAFDGLRRS